ncbi:zona pellucida sperm-binding protein 4-like [Notothenia coriiceps]|uniref:Zona pellucida sperm-binding protein 4-like n=1 Tax=Notothenia coriiceps TaxID=8208 RepID=A0A6I9PQ19_9TELE|nr:PREDICTED: zona pellucida sperm-binding protein 4-like [Notothenia coriiceps]
MAGIKVDLWVVLMLSGTLLLGPVRGWKPITIDQLNNFYETGQWGEPEPSVTSTDDHIDFDEVIPEEELHELGPSTGRNPMSAHHGFEEDVEDSHPQNWASAPNSAFQVEFDDYDAPERNMARGSEREFQTGFEDAPQRNSASGTNSGFQVDFDDADAPERNMARGIDQDFRRGFVNALPRSWTSGTCPTSSGLSVTCSEAGFKIVPTGSLSDVKVLGSKELMAVMDAPGFCGYKVNAFQKTLTVPFTGCNVKHTDGYSLQLLYVDEFGSTQVTTAICDEVPDHGLFPRTSGLDKPRHVFIPTESPKQATNCAVVSGERVTCGTSQISSADCEKTGCCVDYSTSACYHPLDECTGDQHFVFAIRFDSASIPLDPTKLFIPGTTCKPVIVNDKVAIFKFKVTECGARAYEVAGTKIYLAELQTIVKALNLKYGIITRTDPLRFMVECRYGQSGSHPEPLANVGYMVKTLSSSLPSSVMSDGVLSSVMSDGLPSSVRSGVQLRIATDQTYSNYLEDAKLPLRLLLGKPVYLELRLLSPKPNTAIMVNYCIAYTRSTKNALVLICEGCTNPYNPNLAILEVSDLPTNRRFMVQAFQFMDQATNQYLNEEIYFMCSAEVFRTTEKTCAERGFDG